jgi:transposase
LFSEVGRDMSRWPSAGNFVSWLALCPDNDISGGKLLWRGARKVKNRAGQEKRLEAKLKRQAKQLGYELVPIEPKTA